MKEHLITVVGGCNIDLNATSLAPLVSGDSNPGTVTTALGGVGRNIAENLARLRQRVSFMTAIGEDHFTPIIEAHARACGYDMSLSAHDKRYQNSTYLCVNEPSGEMSVAVNDMRICELLTPAFLEARLPHLSCAEAVVLDANLPEDTINYAAEHISAPIFVDSVSSKKAEKLIGALPRLHTIKTNRIEAQVLAGMEIHNMDDVRDCAKRLHDKGVKQVFITLGAQGAFASNGRETLTMPSLAHDIVNTTGCGDAFFAGVVASTLDKLPLEGILLTGLQMAALCATDSSAVAQSLTPEALRAFPKQV